MKNILKKDYEDFNNQIREIIFSREYKEVRDYGGDYSNAFFELKTDGGRLIHVHLEEEVVYQKIYSVCVRFEDKELHKKNVLNYSKEYGIAEFIILLRKY